MLLTFAQARETVTGVMQEGIAEGIATNRSLPSQKIFSRAFYAPDQERMTVPKVEETFRKHCVF